MHVGIPNSGLRVLLSPYCYSPLKLHRTCNVTRSLPLPHLHLHLPPSGSADWLVSSQSKLLSYVDAVCSLRSGMLGHGCGFRLPSCSWRNFRTHWNSCENFSQDDCTLFFRSRNSLCLDSLSAVFLGPTKTDLFCLTWWSAAETQRCSRTRRREGHGGGKESVWFFSPYCRKLLTAEQLLCFLLNSRTRQIGGYVCLPQTQVICFKCRSWGWVLKKRVSKYIYVNLYFTQCGHLFGLNKS